MEGLLAHLCVSGSEGLVEMADLQAVFLTRSRGVLTPWSGELFLPSEAQVFSDEDEDGPAPGGVCSSLSSRSLEGPLTHPPSGPL